MPTTKHELQAEALQWAKYLDNMMRRGYYNDDDDDEMPLPPFEGIPSESHSDYWDVRVGHNEDLPKLEDGLSAKDIIYGPSEEQIEDEYILIGRDKDDYFGYTISHPEEVIAIGKTYKFLDLKLPFSEIGVTQKSSHSGMYASEFTDKIYDSNGISSDDVYDSFSHLKFAFEDVGITYRNDSYDPMDENSFYKLYFCGEDLGAFKDELDAFNTIEEHISQLFLEDIYVGKYKSFTMFSTPEDVFSIDQVCPESVY